MLLLAWPQPQGLLLFPVLPLWFYCSLRPPLSPVHVTLTVIAAPAQDQPTRNEFCRQKPNHVPKARVNASPRISRMSNSEDGRVCGTKPSRKYEKRGKTHKTIESFLAGTVRLSRNFIWQHRDSLSNADVRPKAHTCSVEFYTRHSLLFLRHTGWMDKSLKF